MKTIIRSAEPACLAGQPHGQDWYTFMRTQCHGDLRQNLRQEQKGLCCYCESEVEDGDGHVEHMEPRSRNQARTYDYSNLAISCNGGDRKSTRLNSSHGYISYAVFCLKKKT